MHSVTGQDRQRVSHAAQYVSEEMADAIRKIYPTDPNMQEFADFIHLADGTFDTMNSSSEGVIGKTKDRKCGYGKNIAVQEETLKEFSNKIVK